MMSPKQQRRPLPFLLYLQYTSSIYLLLPEPVRKATSSLSSFRNMSRVPSLHSSRTADMAFRNTSHKLTVPGIREHFTKRHHSIAIIFVLLLYLALPTGNESSKKDQALPIRPWIKLYLNRTGKVKSA